MPAYFDTGFSVRQPMWHGEGLVLDDYPIDWADAREKAGLLWEPVESPLYVARTIDAAELDAALDSGSVKVRRYGDKVEIMEQVADKAIVRNDTKKVLGTVGAGFELVLHQEMGEILESVLGADNVKFETAGSCKDGAQVWALAYIDEPYEIVGDDTQTFPFLALLNSHDGSGACKLTLTQVRVVCWNTYNAASLEGDKHGRQYSFRHTAGVHDRIEEAKDALKGLRNEIGEWQELATELFGLKVDDVQFQHFVQNFIPEPVADVVSDRVRNNVDTARKAFKTLYLDSPTTASHRGTALGLVDASVEYLDHVRAYRNSDTYLGRTLLRPEPLKARAMKLAREVAGV